MNEEQRKAVGLKRFSIISPVLNGQVTNNTEYFRKVAEGPIDMPVFGMRRYSEKTLQGWLSDFNRGGIDALISTHRSDKGKHRKINDDLAEKIIAERQQNLAVPISILYEKLLADSVIKHDEISRPTLYRFIEDMTLRGELQEQESEEKETRRFSYEHAGDLVQIDILYGPRVKEHGKWRTAYLHMVLDDCTRFPMHSQFYLSQSFEAHRHCFKESVLKYGTPRIAYSDNAQIYRSQQFEYICASIGCTLLHSQPFVPKGRGKVERMFRTVRMRFLNGIGKDFNGGLDELNEQYNKWLSDDYLHKIHSSLNGLSPHGSLMSQVDNLRLPSDRRVIDEAFLLRTSRKIGHDATLQLDNVLYETDAIFAGKRMEVRYEPEWIGDTTKSILIFLEGKTVGEAKMVRFNDNAHAKRHKAKKTDFFPQNTISFQQATFAGEENPCTGSSSD